MDCPFDDPPVLSASPPSVRGVSPTTRRSERELSSPTDTVDPVLRARGSPTQTRSVDPNDPDVRERQRTMDVEIALHLSRARRETVVLPTSPFNGPRTDAEPPFGSFSAVERHDLQLARGEDSLVLDPDIVHGEAHGTTSGSATPLGIRLGDNRDPSLFAAVEGPYALPSRQDQAASTPGLPRYALGSPRSVFDFAPLENFATEEKESLGLTSLSSSVIRLRHPKQRKEGGQMSPPLPSGGSFDSTTTAIPRRPGARQRKLSESAPLPRPHRRNGGGKVVLFERQANEPVSGLRLMGSGQLGVVPSSEDVSGMFYQRVPPPPAGVGGILSPGHDRPYRFSFYSSALSATIHARSLCELPAEGQSFEELFIGLPSPVPRQGDATGGPPGFAAPTPVPASRAGVFIPSEQRTPPSSEGIPTSGHNGLSGRPAEKSGPGHPNGSGPPTSTDAEANTWWLDIQSPTDEEMKVLSKVIALIFFLSACTPLTRPPRGVLHPPPDHRRHPNGGSSRED